jgi:hypothetical protein
MGEAIGFEALHTAAFMVNADEQIFSHLFDVSAQLAQLFTVLPIARKQNNAANQRVFEALAVLLGQR